MNLEKARIKELRVRSNVLWSPARYGVKYPLLIAVSDSLNFQKFNVGTGLSDKVRANPPKVGSIVVYRFQDLTRDGVPR
jgi:hypothetical protein